MIFKNKLFLVLLLSLVAAFVKAQDVVVLNNGRKIYCHIVKVDSASISYTLPHQKKQFEIKKTEIYRYDHKSLKRQALKDTSTTSSSHKEFSETLVLGFMGGIATPIEEFASQDINSLASGLATTGGLFQTTVLLKFTDNFGLSVSYLYQSNPFSDYLISESYNAQAKGRAYFTSSSTNWKVRGFFVGLHLSVPVKKVKHLSFDLDLAGGLPKYDLPELTITAYSIGSVTSIQHVSTSSSLTFMGGVGLKYRVHKNVALNVNLNYLRSKVFFKNVFTQFTNGLYSYDDYTQKVGTINVQFGLSFLIFS